MIPPTGKETAYKEATQDLLFAIEETTMTAQQKDCMANILETMDADSDSASNFTNAAISIIKYVSNNAPELLPQTLITLGRAADMHKSYWQ